MIGLFKLSISSWMNFGGYMFLETSAFLLDCQIGWQLFIVFPYNLYFCGINYVLFVSFLIYLGYLSFLLSEPGQRLSILFTLSRNLLLTLFLCFLTMVFNVCMHICIYFWLHWVFVAVCWLSLAVASKGDCLWQCTGFSLLGFSCCRAQALGTQAPVAACGPVVVVNGLRCSEACGFFPDQGWNPRLLPWQADSLPLRYQGNPYSVLLYFPLWPLFKARFVWCEYYYPHFLIFCIFWNYLFPSFPFQSMCVLCPNVGLSWAAY